MTLQDSLRSSSSQATAETVRGHQGHAGPYARFTLAVLKINRQHTQRSQCAKGLYPAGRQEVKKKTYSCRFY